MLTRRALLAGAAGAALTGLAGCRGGSKKAAQAALECMAAGTGGSSDELWRIAARRGIVYGSSAATWQLSDASYAKLFDRQASILFTEDDLLWWRLRPTLTSGLRFERGDRIVDFAERHGQLVLGAHRRGRVTPWIVAYEVTDEFGLRTDVPWYASVGPSYARDAPDQRVRVRDDDEFNVAADRRAAMLAPLDELLDAKVPVHGLGVQAHLHYDRFPRDFDADAYRRFLSDVADRDLEIVITELDVQDDGPRPIRRPATARWRSATAGTSTARSTRPPSRRW